MVQLSNPYMTTGKTVALTRWTFVGKVMSVLLNRLSRLVMIIQLQKGKKLATTWINLVDITLCVISQSQKDKYSVVPLI